MNYYDLDPQKQQKLDACQTREAWLDLIWMWMKSGHISKKEYKAIDDQMNEVYPQSDRPYWDN